MKFREFLKATAGEELKRHAAHAKLQQRRYRAPAPEKASSSNNDGAPPINGVSNRRYFQ